MYLPPFVPTRTLTRFCRIGVCLAVSALSLQGCAQFSTTIRTVEVASLGTSTIPAKAGVRQALVSNISAGTSLIASQPAVKNMLKNTGQVRVDFSAAFIDYCKKSGLFREVVNEPFDVSQVDIELTPQLTQLNNRSTYGTWLVVTTLTLEIPALLGWPYKNLADCQVQVDVRSTDGSFAKTYTGRGSGQKNTNFYKLMFGLKEVPHAMLSINRAVTAAFEDVAQQMIADRASFQGAVADSR